MRRRRIRAPPDLIVKTYDFGTADEVFCQPGQGVLRDRIIFHVKTEDFKSTHRVFASQGGVIDNGG